MGIIGFGQDEISRLHLGLRVHDIFYVVARKAAELSSLEVLEVIMFNVAHFVSPYLPMTETFIYNYIRSFSATRSYVFTHELKNLDQFGIHNLIKMSKYSLPWVLHQIGEKLSLSEGIMDNLLFNRNNTKSVRSGLRNNDIRLVHAHFGHMGCYSLNLKTAMQLPMVTTFYGWDISFLPRVGWAKRYIPLFSAGECFLVEGSHMKKCLVELGCPEDKIRIIHIGADLAHFKYRDRSIESVDRVIMLFCGRFIEKKGLEYALRALALIRDHHKDIQFRVIGDGPLKDDIIGLVEDLELDDVVKLLGYVPYEQTKKEMDNAHILVQPSVTATNGETEGGAPTVLIEAQASGMPILASFHADIPEVVLHRKSGLLSEERNFEQLADHMTFLLDHPEKWPEIGLSGRRHVEENYNIEIEARKIEQIYAELIGDSSGVLGSKV